MSWLSFGATISNTDSTNAEQKIARMSASSLARAETTASRDHAFTDIDANLSLDLSIKGTRWEDPTT